MQGEGLLKGLSVTLKRFLTKKETENYPDVYPDLPDSFRGSFKLNADGCICCSACQKACPNPVIDLEVFKDEDNNRKLDKFEMDLSYCQFCGFCVEACPVSVLQFTPDFELASDNREDLILDLLESEAKEEQKEKQKEKVKQAV